MAEELENLEDAVGRVEADVGNVAAAVAAARDEVAALQAQVAELLAQLTDVTPEQLQALADRVDNVDVALDAIAPDAPPEG